MNENEGFEKIRESVRSYAKNNAGYFAVALLVLAYTATALFQIGKSDKSVWHIVADGTTAMLLGVAVARLLSLQGILRGKQNAGYLATATLHAEVVKEIAPFIGRLDGWCKRKTAEMLRQLRERLLLSGGLKYEECFDENGVAIPLPFREIPCELLPCEGKKSDALKLLEKRKAAQLKVWKREEKKRRRCYERAVRASITPLIGSVLTGSAVKSEDPFDFGKGVAEYEAANVRSGAVSRILSACLFGYFGVDLVKEFTWEELFYRLLQVAIALAFGVVQQYRSFLYVTEEKRGYDIKKIDYLQMFLSDMRAERGQEKEKKENVDNVQI